MSQETTSPSALFSPLVQGKLSVENRFVMAPMTQESSPNNAPEQHLVEHYKERAANNVGLIITEGTCIEHIASNGHINVPVLHGKAAFLGWKKVVDAVHKEGSKIMSQLWHVGAMRPSHAEPVVGTPAYSPSGLIQNNRPNGITMSEHDIEDVINDYAKAAKNAQNIGFDGVEIHGAHGYLIDQFFWSSSNKRNDDYGGSFENRNLFAKRVVAAIRKAVGKDFLIGFRWSQWKVQDFGAKIVNNPAELEVLLGGLAEEGVDMFHCSTREFWQPGFAGSNMSLAGWTKKLSGCTTIAVGGVGTGSDFMTGINKKDPQHVLNLANKALDKEEFDLIAVGRALLSNPKWVHSVNG